MWKRRHIDLPCRAFAFALLSKRKQSKSECLVQPSVWRRRFFPPTGRSPRLCLLEWSQLHWTCTRVQCSRKPLLRSTSPRILQFVGSDGFGSFLDGFGRYRTVSDRFRSVSERFGLFSDRFGFFFGPLTMILFLI